MDESLQELENELKRLTPRSPSSALLVALGRELGPARAAAPARRDSTATSLGSWKWATWPLAGAAALIALGLLVRSNRPLPAAPAEPAPAANVAAATTAVETVQPMVGANRYEPVRASSVLYDLQEGAPTKLPDRTEGREVRYRYVDTYTWKNPATNASVRWSVPRDEVRLVRANLD
jgi:hypothetical protein